MLSHKEVLQEVQKVCRKSGVRLAYLIVGGSHLYGLNTKNSDTDYKGIFVPSKQQLVTKKAVDRIGFSSGSIKELNSPGDFDVELFSLQHWAYDLLPKGEINAVDLLYSDTNKPCVLYCSADFDHLLRYRDSFINPVNATLFTNYIVKKVSNVNKGFYYDLMLQVKKFLESRKDSFNLYPELHDWINPIIYNFYDPQICFSKVVPECPFTLIFCGKIYEGGMDITEFLEIINNRLKFIEDTQVEGVNYKELSHALRAIVELRGLLKYERIKFPLWCADTLKNVKCGNYDIVYCHEIIGSFFKEVEQLKLWYSHKGDRKLHYDVNRIDIEVKNFYSY